MQNSSEKELERQLLAYYRKNTGKIRTKGKIKDIVQIYTSGKRLNMHEEYIREISHYTNVRNKHVLDIGCGFYDFARTLCENGAQVLALEVSREKISIGKKFFHYGDMSYVMGSGESLPFKDDYLDIVFLNYVLEHVKDYKKVLEESIRVVKSGGYIFFRVPNHLWPYEGHYNLPIIPLMPKKFLKIYFSLLGRDIKFLDDINYFTAGRISKFLEEIEVNIPQDFSYENMTWRRASHVIGKNHILNDLRLNNMLMTIIKKLNIYPTLYFVIIKSDRNSQ